MVLDAITLPGLLPLLLYTLKVTLTCDCISALAIKILTPVNVLNGL